jgi:signal transduction histidine kinase
MEANLRLQNSIVTEITQATNNERKRIAQDLHDIIGHSMVNIMMITDSIKDRLNDREGIKSYCDVIHQQASGALSETENSMRTLRKQYDKRKYNSVAIKKLTSIFEKATGVEVLLEFRNAPTTFGEKIDRIVYRCIQEGLTNAFRHGRANRITILYWKHETGEMEITIKDNGKSVKNLNEGIGIWGMRERLSGIGGSITVNPSEFGFSLTLTFPFCTASDQEVVSDDRVGYC